MNGIKFVCAICAMLLGIIFVDTKLEIRNPWNKILVKIGRFSWSGRAQTLRFQNTKSTTYWKSGV
jgi:hypothetical protein